MVYFVNVNYFNVCDNAEHSENCIVIKDSYTEAAKALEDYYGDDLNSFEIALIQDTDICVFEDNFHVSAKSSFKTLF